MCTKCIIYNGTLHDTVRIKVENISLELGSMNVQTNVLNLKYVANKSFSIKQLLKSNDIKNIYFY